MTTETTEGNIKRQRSLYIECLQKQLDEIDMLSSIFCNPGEIQVYDPGVISDFHEFINNELTELYPKLQLDFSIYIQNAIKNKFEIHVNLPHLYPILENAIVTFRTPFSNKLREEAVKNEIENYIQSSDIDKTEPYIYQVITWIQDSLDRFLSNEFITEIGNSNDDILCSISNTNTNNNSSYENNDKYEKCISIDVNTINLIEFERLWIVSHHIRSKMKRQAIVRNARDLNLSGFSKPGKPGIICVEGRKENTQKFWKIIKSMNWHKIQLKINEVKKKNLDEFDKCRRFDGFKEELVTENEDEGFSPMNMSSLIKFLESHRSGYIKKELFGFE